MLKQTKSKVKRMRGTSSHGWGHKKKHRGSGHRGGVGMAGSGARGDSRKSSVLSSAKSLLKAISAKKGIKISKVVAGNKYFGKKGFHSLQKSKRTRVNTLSISYIENNYDKMVENKVIVKDTLDTTALKVDKILGRGKFTRKLNITCNEISVSAKAIIEKAGGKVTVLKSDSDDFEEEEKTEKEEE
jgi:large subunit ribosomal protein L15